jgi:hypothetical protein
LPLIEVLQGCCSSRTILRMTSFVTNRTPTKALDLHPAEVKQMSNKRSSRPQKSSAMQKRGEGNLGQKEARLENEKASELAHMGEKTRESEKSERDEGDA